MIRARRDKTIEKMAFFAVLLLVILSNSPATHAFQAPDDLDDYDDYYDDPVTVNFEIVGRPGDISNDLVESLRHLTRQGIIELRAVEAGEEQTPTALLRTADVLQGDQSIAVIAPYLCELNRHLCTRRVEQRCAGSDCLPIRPDKAPFIQQKVHCALDASRKHYRRIPKDVLCVPNATLSVRDSTVYSFDRPKVWADAYTLSLKLGGCDHRDGSIVGVVHPATPSGFEDCADKLAASNKPSAIENLKLGVDGRYRVFYPAMRHTLSFPITRKAQLRGFEAWFDDLAAKSSDAPLGLTAKERIRYYTSAPLIPQQNAAISLVVKKTKTVLAAGETLNSGVLKIMGWRPQFRSDWVGMDGKPAVLLIENLEPVQHQVIHENVIIPEAGERDRFGGSQGSAGEILTPDSHEVWSANPNFHSDDGDMHRMLDEIDHSTITAGLIGAGGANATGVQGVAPGAKMILMTPKCDTKYNGKEQHCSKKSYVDQITMIAGNKYNKAVYNFSNIFGGGEPEKSELVISLIDAEAAVDKPVIVAAAGNMPLEEFRSTADKGRIELASDCKHFPACFSSRRDLFVDSGYGTPFYDSLISVVGLSAAGEHPVCDEPTPGIKVCYYHGPVFDIAAIGEVVAPAVLEGVQNADETVTIRSVGYREVRGSSFATPIVSALALLLDQKQQSWRVYRELEICTDAKIEVSGHTQELGMQVKQLLAKRGKLIRQRILSTGQFRNKSTQRSFDNLSWDENVNPAIKYSQFGRLDFSAALEGIETDKITCTGGACLGVVAADRGGADRPLKGADVRGRRLTAIQVSGGELTYPMGKVTRLAALRKTYSDHGFILPIADIRRLELIGEKDGFPIFRIIYADRYEKFELKQILGAEIRTDLGDTTPYFPDDQKTGTDDRKKELTPYIILKNGLPIITNRNGQITKRVIAPQDIVDFIPAWLSVCGGLPE